MFVMFAVQRDSVQQLFWSLCIHFALGLRLSAARAVEATRPFNCTGAWVTLVLGAGWGHEWEGVVWEGGGVGLTLLVSMCGDVVWWCRSRGCVACVHWAPAAMAHAVVFVCAAVTHCGAADVAAWRNHGLVQKPELVSPAHVMPMT
jgi:hypothetical protein